MEKFRNEFKEFFDYFVFGIGTILINFGMFFVLNEMVGLYYTVANLIAITLSILFSFWVNKRYVFKTKQKSKKAVVKEFVLFLAIFFLLTLHLLSYTLSIISDQ